MRLDDLYSNDKDLEMALLRKGHDPGTVDFYLHIYRREKFMIEDLWIAGYETEGKRCEIGPCTRKSIEEAIRSNPHTQFRLYQIGHAEEFLQEIEGVN